ncbi:MAG: hypothetical protein IT373_35785 [Polyangiaceae bacterium]|nr:hypothetical protein [Polyangiaceae bacterium]
MAHSIQIVGSKSLILGDIDLLVLLRLLLAEHKRIPARYPSLGPLVMRWENCRAGYGPGIIDLHLAEVAGDETRRADFMELLRGVEMILSTYGEHIPVAVLRDTAPGVHVIDDFETRTVREAIKRVRMLFQ